MLLGFTNEQILGYYGLVPVEPTSYSSEFAYRAESTITGLKWNQKLGISLIVIATGAFTAAYWPVISLEATYQIRTLEEKLRTLSVNFVGASVFGGKAGIAQKEIPGQARNDSNLENQPPTTNNQLPQAVPADFNPLLDPSGNEIEPVNSDFALIVPKVGINAAVIPGVDPVNTAGYSEALKKGVAHSKLSYYPDENGTTYLFSHSTNYEWFIDDLNAVFYYLKNLEANDLIVVMYRNDRYTYEIREKKVVSTKEISYLVPQTGVRTLVLQTCWPPGTVAKRMLIFADLIEAKDYGKFADVSI